MKENFHLSDFHITKEFSDILSSIDEERVAQANLLIRGIKFSTREQRIGREALISMAKIGMHYLDHIGFIDINEVHRKIKELDGEEND